jgi:hypothetical protein
MSGGNVTGERTPKMSVAATYPVNACYAASWRRDIRKSLSDPDHLRAANGVVPPRRGFGFRHA